MLKAIYKAEHEEGRPMSADDLASSGDANETRRALRALERRGAITIEADGRLRATVAGAETAVRLVRAHRLLERFLHDAERMRIEDLHHAAETLEHQVGPDALDDMDRSLGHPAVDPHGHPIPPPGSALAPIAGRPLTDVPPGRRGRVTMVRDDRADLLGDMARLGILPEMWLDVLAVDTNGVSVQIIDHQHVLPTEMATRIFVGHICKLTTSAAADRADESMLGGAT